MSRLVSVLLRTSPLRTSLFRRSLVLTVLFLISRLSIVPVAKPYETPPRETDSAIREITSAGDGARRRKRLM
jgi:uncharacterized membrane protein